MIFVVDFYGTKMNVLIVVAMVILSRGKAVGTNTLQKDRSVDYLVKYGYMSSKPNAFSFNNDLSTSIKLFQRQYGLPETGIFDSTTKQLMKLPRCGNTDLKSNAFSSYQQKWPKFHLTYYFENYSPDMTSSQIKAVIKEAFQRWGNVTPLTFEEKMDMNADIFIKFATGDHGDTFHFDGPGGTLAHAFRPPVGDTHFDDAEFFTFNSTKGVDLMWVAVHEFGHALGLDHSNVDGSVMFPLYKDNRGKVALHADDVKRIRNIYGATAPTTVSPVPTTKFVCKDNLPSQLCVAWNHAGHCRSNVRVRLECQMTCKVC